VYHARCGNDTATLHKGKQTMDTTQRVQRWRQRRRDAGKEAMTIWLSHETKLRLEDLAAVWRVTPSELIEQALAKFQPGTPPRFGNDTATLPLDAAIETVLARVLPARLQEALQHLQPVTATNGNVAATEHPETPVPAPAYEPSLGHSIVTEPPVPRRGGRPPSRERQQILDVLTQHPEGLTVEQMRGMLTPTRPLGDVLAGMRRTGAVRTEGQGRTLRYFPVKDARRVS
jgi:hypothetical protein